MSLLGRLLSHIQFLKNPIFDRTTPLKIRGKIQAFMQQVDLPDILTGVYLRARSYFFQQIYVKKVPKFHL